MLCYISNNLKRSENMFQNLKAEKMREIYFDFFKQKNHALIPSASLIPENDPTVLFTTAGMHPLVPYLLGEKHPAGNRLVNVQKCLRTCDIEAVGDATHCTFFEMLGNWSLGDYFKDESIAWSFEFLTSADWLNLDEKRLYVTVFAGDEDAPRDEESYQKWLSLGIAKEKIFFCSKKENWWESPGETGPCGPDTEIFYDTLKEKCNSNCNPTCDCGKYVEIWNNVFMEYNKKIDGSYEKLKQQNVDTGMGLERIFATLLKKESIYTTELFINLINKLEMISKKKYQSESIRSFRIIADHVRTATFVLGDEKGVVPANTDQGYVLRRVIRRAIRYLKKLEVEKFILPELAQVVIEDYQNQYPELRKNEKFIFDELRKEEELFNKTINQGIREFNKILDKLENNEIPGNIAFKLYDTYGFPLEFTVELADEKGLKVDEEGFAKCYLEHQEKSRAGATKKFKGGLAGTSLEEKKLHTTTHILQGVLRNLFGEHIIQKGANITPERLRFDFSFERKLTLEEISIIEKNVNEIIKKDLPITVAEMSVEEAEKKGIIGVFKDRYENKVKVYMVGDFSKEICGGPHVSRTSELGTFKIKKEESISAGVRRIKAVLKEGD